MSEDDVQVGQKTMRQHLVAAARDILVFTAMFGVVGSAVGALLAPYWLPFRDLPIAVSDLGKTVSQVQATLTELQSPKVIDVAGIGLIVGENTVHRGDTLTLFYMLRRNITCVTRYNRNFFNVNTATQFNGGSFIAQQAPVTTGFIPFKIEVTIPMDMPYGEYSYIPVATPIECGIYEPIVMHPTETFSVVPKG